MANQAPIYCVECGAYLGLGIPGASAPCRKCGEYVGTKTAQGDTGSALGGLLLVGIAALGTIAAVAFVKSLFDQ